MVGYCIPYISDEKEVSVLKTICWEYHTVSLLVLWGYTEENYNYQKRLECLYNEIVERGSIYIKHDDMGLILVCMNQYRKEYPNGGYGQSMEWKKTFSKLYSKMYEYWIELESRLTGRPAGSLMLGSNPWSYDFHRVRSYAS